MTFWECGSIWLRLHGLPESLTPCDSTYLVNTWCLFTGSTTREWVKQANCPCSKRPMKTTQFLASFNRLVSSRLTMVSVNGKRCCHCQKISILEERILNCTIQANPHAAKFDAKLLTAATVEQNGASFLLTTTFMQHKAVNATDHWANTTDSTDSPPTIEVLASTNIQNAQFRYIFVDIREKKWHVRHFFIGFLLHGGWPTTSQCDVPRWSLWHTCNSSQKCKHIV